MLDYLITDLIAVANQEKKKTQETKKYLRIAYEACIIKKEHNIVQYCKLKNSQNSALKSPPHEGKQKLNFNTRGNNPIFLFFFQLTKTFSPHF